jgi:hypothetical protein
MPRDPPDIGVLATTTTRVHRDTESTRTVDVFAARRSVRSETDGIR